MTDTHHPSDPPVSQSPPIAASSDADAFRDITVNVMQTIESIKKEESVVVLEQTKIQAGVITKFLYLVFGLVGFLASIGGLSLFWGDPDTGTQIIASSIAFLGGIGFGIGLKR